MLDEMSYVLKVAMGKERIPSIVALSLSCQVLLRRGSVLVEVLLCAPSVFSVSLWLLYGAFL